MASPSTDEMNILKILIATDNHLGVWEKDEVRKEDSFVTFREILELALEQQVDMVLLGGDLFHDNKPSLTTLHRAVSTLSEFCLKGRPITFDVIGGEEDGFAARMVNFHHPDVNVGLPIFTIHGNHDDPSGDHSLSAVDVLSSCKLVNYFGRAQLSGSGVGKLQIAPILLQKGSTKVALYGMGNIREERIVRAFMTPDHVKWTRPADENGQVQEDAYFNIFVLHQNRVAHSASSKDTLRESHLPTFLDFVVWGHEHECIIDPWEAGTDSQLMSIVQPGSSVATALSEGESKPKHALVLEIMEGQWRTVKVPLRTVRPFLHESVVLSEQEDLDPERPETVTAFLEDHMGRMILAASSRPTQTAGSAPHLPLVRLRVDYTGFSTINTQRFGQQFVGKVANPHDMILWHKAPVRKAKAGRGTDAQNGGDGVLDVEAPQQSEVLDSAQMEALIAQNLQERLQLLPELELASALANFVDKDEKGALADAVKGALAAARTAAQNGSAADTTANGHATDDAALDALLARHLEERQAQQAANPNREQVRRSTLPEAPGAQEPSTSRRPGSANPPRPSSAGRGRGRQGGRGRGRQTSLDAFRRGNNKEPDASQASGDQRSTQRSAARPRRAAAAAATARTSRAVLDSDDDEEEAMDDEEMSDAEQDLDMDAVEDDSDDDPTPAPPRNAVQMEPVQRRGRRLSLGASKSPATGRRPRAVLEDSEAQDDEDPAPPPAKVASQGGRRLPMSLSSQGASQRQSLIRR